MPLDVFYEIVSYMHPSDLLRISRVSKHFRKMLMTKNAVSFWRAARRNIGMPEPPPDLNDAQYVALIFEHVCNVCRSLFFSPLAATHPPRRRRVAQGWSGVKFCH
ncbi:hypothetical protein BDM02DRAFT_3221319 [Thelephora ganbajun]|uniref:Uncharacterized protein n=1 Tax=Thelephora ganbajun TaxID=370292 RepID=A0ACB6ZLM2_THEGA|nr:hypothetical protein BDM02DRAFT_3221319 [Thelephora ganbajun]